MDRSLYLTHAFHLTSLTRDCPLVSHFPPHVTCKPRWAGTTHPFGVWTASSPGGVHLATGLLDDTRVRKIGGALLQFNHVSQFCGH